MDIKPVKKYPGILPAAAALLGSMITGCDRQTTVGSVPFQKPKDVEQQPIGRYLINEPEEQPQAIGGDVPDVLPVVPGEEEPAEN
ncbi:MAG: hypothetical protein IKZ10_06685 [Akkermansia sp.]|nr:hypothetical protein [Akkermansia sp.]